MLEVDAIILAAGNSSRLGQNKQLLRLGDQSLIQRAVATTRAAPIRKLVVVTGFAAAALRRELLGLAYTEVFNPNWAQGMGGSLAAALQSPELRSWRPRAVLVVLPDQYLVTTQHLTALIDRHALGDKGIVATDYGVEHGAPAVFGQRYFSQLAALAPQAGARAILKHYADDVALIACPDAVADIDTHADLQRLGAQISQT